MRGSLEGTGGRALLLLASLVAALAMVTLTRAALAGSGDIADHVVISEVYPDPVDTESGGEWIELYNPTDSKVDVGEWVIDTKTYTDADVTLPLDTEIPGRGFYFIGDESDDVWTPDEASWPTPDYTETMVLANDDGWVRLRKSSGGEIVDTVGWGSAVISETAPVTEPAEGGSIERKANSGSTSTSMEPGGSDELSGNGYDSDDNSDDFVLRTTSQPQNSSSLQEPGVRVTAWPDSIVANNVSTSAITATVSYTSGYAADGTIVTFTTSLGSLGASALTDTTESGVATATLTGTTPGVAVVTATAGSASDRTRLTLFQSGLDPASVHTDIFTGSGTVSNLTGANLEAVITATESCTTTVVSGGYTSTPGTAPDFTTFAGAYVDVQLAAAPCASQIEIRLYYPVGVPNEQLLKLHWWDGTSWQLCSHQGVTTTDVQDYGGYIWAVLGDETSPTLNDLTGTPFGGGRPGARPVGGVTYPVESGSTLAPGLWMGLAVSAVLIPALLMGGLVLFGVRDGRGPSQF